MRVLVLIPARYASSRFPGKPLAKILGKSMIQRVFENCNKSGYDTYVVTDDERIESHVNEFGKAIRVDDDIPSGTERIFLAYQRNFKDKGYDFVINVQGDEPLLEATDLKELCNFHENSNFDITTVVKKRESTDKDFLNPNVVKAVYSENSSQCLYFSRSSTPFDREGKGHSWYQHIGVYCFKSQALINFCEKPISKLENLEKLEQLRALENSMTIGAVITTKSPLGVDTPDDIKRVEEVLNEKK